MDAIEDALNTLKFMPERTTPIGGGKRRLIIDFGKNGYVAHYRIKGARVTILRVRHGLERRKD